MEDPLDAQEPMTRREVENLVREMMSQVDEQREVAGDGFVQGTYNGGRLQLSFHGPQPGGFEELPMPEARRNSAFETIVRVGSSTDHSSGYAKMKGGVYMDTVAGEWGEVTRDGTDSFSVEDDEFAVSVDQYLVVAWETDENGVVTSDPDVTVENSVAASTAFNPSTGTSGSYYMPIAKFVAVDGTLQVRQYHTGTLWLGNGVSGESGHQFKISVVQNGSVWDATVAAGTVLAPRIYEDSDSPALPVPVMQSYSVAEELLAGLADNTTYGIWLEIDAAQPQTGISYTVQTNPTATDTIDTKVGAGELLLVYDTGPGAYASPDSTNTTSSSVGAKVGATTGTGYLYIGQIAIASGVVTITQAQEGSVSWFAPTYTHGIVSGDTDNDIDVGADGGLFLDVVAGTDISITGGGGTITINYSP